jgi:hypothetical protein
VTQAAAVTAGMKLSLTFGDGVIPAIAEAGGKPSRAAKRPASDDPAPPAPKPKKGGPKDGGPQGSLL